MSTTLFNIEDQYLDLMQQIEEAEGELTPELEEQLDINQKDLENKVKAYHHVIVQNKGEADTIDEEIKRLQSLKQIKTNLVDKLREKLLNATIIFGYDGKSGNKKMDFDTLKMWTKFTRPVIIDDEDKFIESYKHTQFTTSKTTFSISKKEVKDFINGGAKLDGAHIDEIKQSITIK